jgi:4-amino-4-deoxy-L-arabinose transferase-like glycosyltransferase
MAAANRTAQARSVPQGLTRPWRGIAERVRATPAPLALLLVVAAVLGSAWSLVLPPFQGPDESEHFAYVQHLAETGSPPSSSVAAGAGPYATQELQALDRLGLRAMQGNPYARPMWGAADERRWEQLEGDRRPGERSDGEGPNFAAKNPPLYYAYEAVAYRLSPDTSLFGRLLAARLASVLLLVATVALTWVAISELTQRGWARVLAAGVVALQPQLAFIGAIVNPDILLTALWTAFVALSIRTLRRGRTTGRLVGLCALAALAALTHGRGLALLPPLAVVLVLAWWRERPPSHVLRRWLAGAAALLAAVAVVLVVGRGRSLYGGQLAAFQDSGFDPRQFVSHVWQFYFPPLPTMQPRLGPDYGFRQVFVETFYGTFGSLDVHLPARVYALLQVASVLGLLALYTAVVVRRRELRERGAVLLGLASIALSGIVFLHLASYLALLDGPDPVIVGRYLLPLIALFALAIAFVATSLPRRLGPIFAAVVLASGVLLQLAGLGLTVARFYG